MSKAKLELWQKLWLLFTVIWGVVSALNAVTIYAFAEGLEREKVWRPVILGIAVPAVVYLLAWAWHFLRKRKSLRNGGSAPEPGDH